MKPLLKRADGGLNLLAAFPLLAWNPIQSPQAVQDGAANLVLSVGFQLYVVPDVKPIDAYDSAILDSVQRSAVSFQQGKSDG